MGFSYLRYNYRFLWGFHILGTITGFYGVFMLTIYIKLVSFENIDI